MAIELFGEDSPEQGTRIVYRLGGEDIVLIVRPVPASVRRRIEQRVTGNVKARKFGDQPLSVVGDQVQKITAHAAAYALLDTAGFSLLTKSPALLASLKAAGLAAEAGVPVSLDGKWTDGLRVVVFEALPSMASFVLDAADKLAGVEREQEVELGET